MAAQHLIDKVHLLYREHNTVDFPAQTHQHTGRDHLRPADPVDGLVVTEDAHLRHFNAHLTLEQAGEGRRRVARPDAADLPERIQFQAAEFIKVFHVFSLPIRLSGC